MQAFILIMLCFYSCWGIAKAEHQIGPARSRAQINPLEKKVRDLEARLKAVEGLLKEYETTLWQCRAHCGFIAQPNERYLGEHKVMAIPAVGEGKTVKEAFQQMKTFCDDQDIEKWKKNPRFSDYIPSIRPEIVLFEGFTVYSGKRYNGEPNKPIPAHYESCKKNGPSKK